jgi:hypothetical protein
LRIVTWFFWAVVFAIVPFIAVYLWGWMDSGGTWPKWQDVIGTGQLMLSTIGLFGVAIKDLLLREEAGPKLLRLTVISSSAVGIFLLAFLYGGIASKALGGSSLTPADQVAEFSAWAYVFGLIVSLGATLLQPRRRNMTAQEEVAA